MTSAVLHACTSNSPPVANERPSGDATTHRNDLGIALMAPSIGPVPVSVSHRMRIPPPPEGVLRAATVSRPRSSSMKTGGEASCG